MMGTSKAFK